MGGRTRSQIAAALRNQEVYKQGKYSAAKQIRIKKASKHKKIGWVDDYWPSFDEWEMAKSSGLKEYLRDTEWPPHVLDIPAATLLLSPRGGNSYPIWLYLKDCDESHTEP